MATEAGVHVTVVLACGPRQVEARELMVPSGCTAAVAIQQSGLLHALPQEQVDALSLGIWGRKATGNRILRDHDRIELYRPLTVDPKVARRERFAKQGAKSAGLFAKRRDGAKAGY